MSAAVQPPPPTPDLPPAPIATAAAPAKPLSIVHPALTPDEAATALGAAGPLSPDPAVQGVSNRFKAVAFYLCLSGQWHQLHTTTFYNERADRQTGADGAATRTASPHDYKALPPAFVKCAATRKLLNGFKRVNDIPDGRLILVQVQSTDVLPEHLTEGGARKFLTGQSAHSDAADHAMIACLRRDNISGARNALVKDYQANNVAMRPYALQEGEVLLWNDNEVYHMVEPIRLVDESTPGNRTVLLAHYPADHYLTGEANPNNVLTEAKGYVVGDEEENAGDTEGEKADKLYGDKFSSFAHAAKAGETSGEGEGEEDERRENELATVGKSASHKAVYFYKKFSSFADSEPAFAAIDQRMTVAASAAAIAAAADAQRRPAAGDEQGRRDDGSAGTNAHRPPGRGACFHIFTSFSEGQAVFAGLDKAADAAAHAQSDAGGALGNCAKDGKERNAKEGKRAEPKDGQVERANAIFSSFEESMKDGAVFPSGGDVASETASSAEKATGETEMEGRAVYLGKFSDFKPDSAQTTVFKSSSGEKHNIPATATASAVNHTEANGQYDKYCSLFSTDDTDTQPQTSANNAGGHSVARAASEQGRDARFGWYRFGWYRFGWYRSGWYHSGGALSAEAGDKVFSDDAEGKKKTQTAAPAKEQQKDDGKAMSEAKDKNVLLANFLFSSFNDSVKDDPMFSTDECGANQSSSKDVKAEEGKEKRMTYFPGGSRGFSSFTDGSNVFNDGNDDMAHTTSEIGGHKDVPETSAETAPASKKSEYDNEGKHRITYLVNFSKFHVESAQTAVFANAKDEEKVAAIQRPTMEDSNAVNHTRANGQCEKYQALFSVANEGSSAKDK